MAGTFKFYLKNWTNSDGTQTVMLRYTYEREQLRLATSVRVREKDFNPKAAMDSGKWIRLSNSNYATYNHLLASFLKKVMAVVAKLESLQVEPTTRAVQKYLESFDENGEAVDNCYLAYFRNVMETIKAEGKRRTAMNYDAVYHKVRTFINIDHLKKPDLTPKMLREMEEEELARTGAVTSIKNRLPFSQITYRFIREYEQWELKLNGRTTVSKSLQKMKKVYNDAADEEIAGTEKNPFKRIKLSFDTSEKERLDLEDFDKLGALELSPEKKEYHVRNLFLFMFYAHGIRIGDALTLRRKDIKKMDGSYILHYEMEKTGSRAEIVLPDQVIPYIEGYMNKKGKQFLFPFLKDDVDYSDHLYRARQIEAKTTYINKTLKKLARKAELIKYYDEEEQPVYKELSCHVARHSFADLARKQGADLYSISKALRHSSVKITEIYLSSFDSDAVSGLNHVYGTNKTKTQE